MVRVLKQECIISHHVRASKVVNFGTNRKRVSWYGTFK